MAKDDMWVRFKRKFNDTPPEDRRVTTQYPAGFEGSVKRASGERAIAAGAAEEIPTPPKGGAGGEGGAAQDDKGHAGAG